MLETMIGGLLMVVALYLALGVAAVIALQIAGLKKFDSGVVGAGVWFRALITPGVIALWPLLVARWQTASRGNLTRGEADRQVAAAGLRRRHLRLSFAMAVIVPALAAVGLVARPGSPPADPSARRLIPEPEPLTGVEARWQEPFAGQPISATLRRDGTGRRQIELEVGEDLEIPGLVLFWSPAGDDRQVFLGAVWGPATRRFGLPAESGPGGRVSLYSMGHRELVDEFDLTKAEAPESGE